ncbi:unnamed protein product [Sphenostylis stenocarpa]|uniref:Uncharacterized protein n=1 Tax=Sphenostylis stenocarpa TaxID=92480 RepID=A0AA86ST12_9FABA|nr:unnamed protein product [Sphenostylis stenocarpa]
MQKLCLRGVGVAVVASWRRFFKNFVTNYLLWKLLLKVFRKVSMVIGGGSLWPGGEKLVQEDFKMSKGIKIKKVEEGRERKRLRIFLSIIKDHISNPQ